MQVKDTDRDQGGSVGWTQTKIREVAKQPLRAGFFWYFLMIKQEKESIALLADHQLS